MKTGIVYTETVVHAPPEQFAADAPYQLAIIALNNGGGEAEAGRVTVRILGERVKIGDAVEWSEDRNGVPFFRKI
jgi:uncharacterized OB-fold protein